MPRDAIDAQISNIAFAQINAAAQAASRRGYPGMNFATTDERQPNIYAAGHTLVAESEAASQRDCAPDRAVAEQLSPRVVAQAERARR